MHRSAATPDARAKPGNLYREPGCPGPDAPPSRFPPTPQCVTAHTHTSQHTTHDSQYLTCSTCAHVQLTAHSTHTQTHDTQHTCTHCVPAKPFMLFCHKSCLPPGPDAVDTLWACRWLKETQYNKPSSPLKSSMQGGLCHRSHPHRGSCLPAGVPDSAGLTHVTRKRPSWG